MKFMDEKKIGDYTIRCFGNATFRVSFLSANGRISHVETIFDSEESATEYIMHCQNIDDSADKLNELKKIRKITGLSQQAFSDKYNIPKRTIENWESGKNNCPRYVLDLLRFKVMHDYSE